MLPSFGSNPPLIILILYFLQANLLYPSISPTQQHPHKAQSDSANSTTVDEISYESSQEYPVSLPALQHLLHLENRFFKLLQTISDTEEVLDENLRISIYKYLTRYKTEVIKGLENWKEASNMEKNLLSSLEHPFLIFQMLRRLVYDFPPLYSQLTNTSKWLEKNLPELDFKKWPSKLDANYYGSLIVVLHHFYDFTIHKFGRGMFGKIVTGVYLSAVQSIELNYIATKTECHSSAVEFMAFALSQARKYGGISMTAVEEAFKTSIMEHDQALVSFSQHGNYGLFFKHIGTISNFTENRHKFITKKSFMKHLGKTNFPRRQGDKAELEEMDSHNYMSICKGENWQSNDQRKSLKCYYKFISGISPYKIETLNVHPLIIKIQDFIQPSLATALINYALPRLVPAKSVEEGYLRQEGKVVSQRAGLVARIEDYPNTKALWEMERRMELITGLNVRGTANGEKLQVASTIPGGYMNYHLDSTRRILSKTGDSRIATFMIYLNKVDAGGRTGFHRLGLAIRPAAHSALFWFNHFRNGTIIDAMTHGGCPLVLGQKWVATKWIRGSGNMNTYKCSRKRME